MQPIDRTYIRKAQEIWNGLTLDGRKEVLRQLDRADHWATSFDLYGDMPISLSDDIVRHFLYVSVVAQTQAVQS